MPISGHPAMDGALRAQFAKQRVWRRVAVGAHARIEFVLRVADPLVEVLESTGGSAT